MSWGRVHLDLSAHAALIVGLVIVIACAVCAWQDQTDLPEAANSEVTQ